ncbi:MAG: UvrD-helicase domain-containing protein [Oscillibacter sp.]|nr:UvrD-helicase domain-containing protein [Oscillibacter sp.]
MKRFQEMSTLSDTAAFSQYLGRKGVDWRKFHGDGVGKLKISAGDRLLCAWAEDLGWKKNNAFVLLEWQSHDNQEKYSFEGGITQQDCVPLQDILEMFYDLGVLQPSDVPGEAPPDSDNINLSDASDILRMIWEDYSRMYLRTDEELVQGNTREVHLSARQLACIDTFQTRKTPMLLLGSAGSGKTLVAVHVLNDLPVSPAVYLTQSNELLHYSKGIYDELRRDRGGVPDKNVSFLNINDYCMEKLGWQEENFVRTKGFLKFLEFSSCWRARKPDTPLPMSIWREIRGVIKGYMGADWNRNAPLSQEQFPRLDRLFRDGYLRRCGNGPLSRKFTLSKSVALTRIDLEEARRRAQREQTRSARGGRTQSNAGLSQQDEATMERVLQYYSRFTNVPPLLPRDEYLKLKEEDTALEARHREFIYTLAEEYESYLRSHHLFDENDLARTLLERDWDTLPAFELVVVDEVQDYTEMQIFLIHHLSKNGRLLLFTGDEHQTIHPTVFSPGHMGKLYYGEFALQKQLLTTNYRCRQCILDKVNVISALRRDHTGRRDSDVEQPETSINPGGGMVYRLRYDSETLPQLFADMAKYPDAVILTPDEQEKQRVEAMLAQVKAKHRYVFTAAEIKGVEYDFVLCFNMMGRNHDALERIFSEGKRRSTGNRYYFNLIYVGMTRARQYLGFVDLETVPPLEEALDLPTVSYGQAEARLKSLGSEDRDWLAKAAELERAGLYQEALEYYREGHAAPEDEYRCMARHAEYEAEPRDYFEAAKWYLLARDWESLERTAGRVKNRNNLPYHLLRYMIAPDTLGTDIPYEGGFMSKLVKAAYPKAAEQRIARRVVRERMADQLEASCAELLRWMENVRNGKESAGNGQIR